MRELFKILEVSEGAHSLMGLGGCFRVMIHYLGSSRCHLLDNTHRPLLIEMGQDSLSMFIQTGFWQEEIIFKLPQARVIKVS
jgi:hypothetical protein